MATSNPFSGTRRPTASTGPSTGLHQEPDEERHEQQGGGPPYPAVHGARVSQRLAAAGGVAEADDVEAAHPVGAGQAGGGWAQHGDRGARGLDRRGVGGDE